MPSGNFCLARSGPLPIRVNRFAEYYLRLISLENVGTEAKLWRKGQITGESYNIGHLARAIDAFLLADDTDLPNHDRELLKRLESNQLLLVEMERKVVDMAVGQRQIELSQRDSPVSGADSAPYAMAVIHLRTAVDTLIEQRRKLTAPTAEPIAEAAPQPSVHAQDFFRASEE